MLSKQVKARRKYKAYCRVKSRRRGRRVAIKACDWIYRVWFMSEPVGPFRSIDEFHETLFHRTRYLVGFRSRMKKFVRGRVVWHKRHPLVNDGMSAYQLALEFKRFLTQDLNVRIGQTYVF